MKDFMKKWVKDCPFSEIYEQRARAENSHPVKEFGYVRADYDGYRWWNTWFPINHGTETSEMIAELNSLYSEFIKHFSTLKYVCEFCRENAAKVGNDEYNMFLVGEHGKYWFRFILRQGDYNLYLHAYQK